LPPGPAWLRPLLGDDYFQTVYSINVQSCSDDDLAKVAALGSVKDLRLGGVEITNQGLAHLAKMTSLESLSLTAILVKDEGLEHLASLANLKQAELVTNATPAGIDRLRSALPNCRIRAPAQQSFSPPENEQ
jgi:hypothetical protein